MCIICPYNCLYNIFYKEIDFSEKDRKNRFVLMIVNSSYLGDNG